LIPRSLCLANGKGGVGKSSLAANIAGSLALGGWRTLLVDLDPQANLTDELGVSRDHLDDAGESLKEAVASGGARAVSVVAEVRQNLDVIPAGSVHTAELADQLHWRIYQRARRSPATTLEELRALEPVLRPIADNYDVVIFDTPPATGTALSDLALATANYLVIPTRVDRSSMHGLEILAERYQEITKTVNPDLLLLAVVLFDIGTTHHAILSEARAALEEALGGVAPVLGTFVRHAPRASEARNQGQLAYEYEATKTQARTEAMAAAKTKRANPFNGLARFGSNAEGLARDYQLITEELVELMAKAEGVEVEQRRTAEQ
jgi:cellulose biosynthesis protein BcsQ